NVNNQLASGDEDLYINEHLEVDEDFRLEGAFEDNNGNTGSPGDVLTSTGSGVEWQSGGGGSNNYWDRDATNGEMYPSNTGDDVGIGTGNPSARLDIRGGDMIFNEDGNNHDVRMETQNESNAFLVDASDDMVYMGDQFGDYENGDTIDGVAVDYVANMDNGDIDGTAIGIGSIEYFFDKSNETTINNQFSPAKDNLHDLGSSGLRWDEVFAQNGNIQTSDRRDKKNIRDLNYGLDKIMKLDPVTYQWKEDVAGMDAKDQRIGLIAQEVHKVLDEVVKTEETVTVQEKPLKKEVKEMERWGIYYSDIIPVLVQSVQDQQAIIDDQKERIDNLEKRLNQLEAKVND
ncbi:MAG: hypothetical protein BRD50_03765, partial [Bacteroidetes bacterium SW_11_45_7]